MTTDRKRYIIVGTGSRCRMFIDAIVRTFPEHAQLVGLCDVSETRMAFWNEYLDGRHGGPDPQDADGNPSGGGPVPAYHADRFDALIEAQKPDVVIVTSVDATHDRYIVRAMELGCDAITEKPMTTDARKCQRIFDAIERTGQKLRVAFNYRWMPAFSEVQRLVQSGAIGTPTLVDFQWRLDTSHGADYFRRWHREKKHSGGLLVHKSTHHFDLIHWILGDRPAVVSAMGGLKFYGAQNARARGQQYDYDRYTGHATRDQDPFAFNLDDNRHWESLPRLYLAAEKDAWDQAGNGYVRDRNVFGGEEKYGKITAEDTMMVHAAYTKGTLLNYSLVAYCPWEGERLTITGTEGQLEYFGRGQGHIIAGQSDEALAAEQYQGEKYLRLQRMFEPAQVLEIPAAQGGHGGGDAKLLRRIFLPDAQPDPQGRDATHLDGVWSVLTGVAANQSIATGLPVHLDTISPRQALPR